jgi:hypothetical protein
VKVWPIIVGSIVWLCIPFALLALAVWLLYPYVADGVDRASDAIDSQCTELCEGRGLEVASHTIHGCECR